MVMVRGVGKQKSPTDTYRPPGPAVFSQVTAMRWVSLGALPLQTSSDSSVLPTKFTIDVHQCTLTVTVQGVIK